MISRLLSTLAVQKKKKKKEKRRKKKGSDSDTTGFKSNPSNFPAV
jgi:hypothetical protein